MRILLTIRLIPPNLFAAQEEASPQALRTVRSTRVDVVAAREEAAARAAAAAAASAVGAAALSATAAAASATALDTDALAEPRRVHEAKGEFILLPLDFMRILLTPLTRPP